MHDDDLFLGRLDRNSIRAMMMMRVCVGFVDTEEETLSVKMKMKKDKKGIKLSTTTTTKRRRNRVCCLLYSLCYYYYFLFSAIGISSTNFRCLR